MTFLAVSTGVDSFANPKDLGPLYPFVGAEWVFLVLAVLAWVGWHLWQGRFETRDNAEARAMYERLGLDRAMYYAGSADIPADEEWERSRHVAVPVDTAVGEPAGERDIAHDRPERAPRPAT